MANAKRPQYGKRKHREYLGDISDAAEASIDALHGARRALRKYLQRPPVTAQERLDFIHKMQDLIGDAQELQTGIRRTVGTIQREIDDR